MPIFMDISMNATVSNINLELVEDEGPPGLPVLFTLGPVQPTVMVPAKNIEKFFYLVLIGAEEPDAGYIIFEMVDIEVLGGAAQDAALVPFHDLSVH